MIQYDLFGREDEIPSTLYLSPNGSTDSVSTALTQYTLDEDYGKAHLTSTDVKERVDAVVASGQEYQDKSSVRQESDKLERKPFLASYEYLTDPATLVGVPSTHALAGCQFVQQPFWRYAFTPVISPMTGEDSRDLLKFCDEVIRPRTALGDREMFQDEGWKRVPEPEFLLTCRPGDKVSSLLDSRAKWTLHLVRARMKSWVESKIDAMYSDRKPNFDYRQLLERQDFGRYAGLSWMLSEGRALIELEAVERRHEEEWGEWVLGEELPYIWTNPRGESGIIVPSIRRASTLPTSG
ncbi:hypothetical protein I302_100950 [Kwoniella bestiolae CBS 10118]|uniref:Uncharacterized protein n=1 Tax=Kwoniella bestiolae CBS 10118 TaxID=1296100 RepID=A0A1B9G6L0_9TREE|nr:hypothetical protein I302_04327 [Kwoniella bestiolae CBS 10118]OCF26641.1 hypothetical protein I302_04327 [Kwoniella bestiolae CBS 10118]